MKNVWTKYKKPIISIALICLNFGIMIVGMSLSTNTETEEVHVTGTATAESATEALEDGFGSTNVISLADVASAKETEDPLTYMVENSEVEVDEDAVNNLVDIYRIGLESTANAQEVSYNELLLEMGYSSDDLLIQSLYTYYYSFLQTRAVVFAVAAQEGLTINREEYEEQLDTYAEYYGFSSGEEMAAYCDEDSIANEMLYNKTIAFLNN